MIDNGVILPAMGSQGEQIVVPWPAITGFRTWFTGAGDDLDPTPPSTGRGLGQRLRLSFDGADDKQVDIQFREPVQLHDGELFYGPIANWDMDDVAYFSVVIPTTSYQSLEEVSSSSSSSSGVAEETPVPVLPYATGLGYNILIPNHPASTHRVFPSDMVPVPTSNERTNPTGYWESDIKTGVCTPGTPGESTYHLMDAEVLVPFIHRVPMGHPRGMFNVDVYKAEWIHPNWKLRFRIDKNSSGAGEAAIWLMCFREFAN